MLSAWIIVSYVHSDITVEKIGLRVVNWMAQDYMIVVELRAKPA